MEDTKLHCAHRDVERRQQMLQQEQQKLAQLQAKQAKEEKDVAKMQRPGLTKFKARLAGNIDSKTEKEKQEAEAAKQDVWRVHNG